jgi:hypothetical protein
MWTTDFSGSSFENISPREEAVQQRKRARMERRNRGVGIGFQKYRRDLAEAIKTIRSPSGITACIARGNRDN